MALRIASTLFLALVFASQAHATDAAASALRSWGLLGKWSTECYKPGHGGSPPNPYVTFAVEPDEKLIYENSAGNIADVTAASVNADGTITVRLQFLRPSTDNRTMVLERVGQGIRPILNRNDENVYTIRNGLLVATGKQVSALYECLNVQSIIDHHEPSRHDRAV
jgi:hypothetical protein